VEQVVFAGVPQTLRPQLGIAGGRFTALVAAMRANPGQTVHVLVEEAADFLATEPVSSLSLPIETADRLRLLGIDTCGQYATLPRHAVEAQFGFGGGTAWLAARGDDPRPLHPRPW